MQSNRQGFKLPDAEVLGKARRDSRKNGGTEGEGINH